MIRDLLRFAGDMLDGLTIVSLLSFPLWMPFVVVWIGPKPKTRR